LRDQANTPDVTSVEARAGRIGFTVVRARANDNTAANINATATASSAAASTICPES
jgi:hypothetical protein